jgi:hypothetical protein
MVFKNRVLREEEVAGGWNNYIRNFIMCILHQILLA